MKHLKILKNMIKVKFIKKLIKLNIKFSIIFPSILKIIRHLKFIMRKLFQLRINFILQIILIQEKILADMNKIFLHLILQQQCLNICFQNQIIDYFCTLIVFFNIVLFKVLLYNMKHKRECYILIKMNIFGVYAIMVFLIT